MDTQYIITESSGLTYVLPKSMTMLEIQKDAVEVTAPLLECNMRVEMQSEGDIHKLVALIRDNPDRNVYIVGKEIINRR